MISRGSIEQAAGRIRDRVRTTPVLELEAGAFGCPAQLFLKLELLQHTGSFKPRGAFNRMLAGDLPEAGVIAASGGNHAAAVAFAARQLGCSAEIFVPETTPELKIERVRQHGARITLAGRSYAEAFAASSARADKTGALVVHAYDQEDVLAGQGTLGRELAAQLPDLDTVLVAVGGGGLIGGIAAWFEGEVRVIGVESTGTATLARALEAGRPVDIEVSGLAADSLGARRVGGLMFPIAQRFVERVVIVDDSEIRSAQRALWDRLRIVAEPGGAAAFAAVLSGKYQPQPGDRKSVV